ncbi:3-oxoadipate enol-lactonase [Lysobacteraceae bacterium NML93-0792]|nr:3-oxoadipate enol-lactonase [Xanthomonadaceae bacterium NML93-0792]PBS16548.1 3-oxoadipate enol-lactonase [Xanthomonadaceae bacterium NML93-0793]PBS19923.1 3-oxoadipate enol-lactonase [Xanthomonadaceae bacterium NML93-0831]
MSATCLDLPTHRLHYRVEGPANAPWLVFCNSLGTDLSMWDAQAAAFASDFRVLRYDRRGHGASTAPTGAYTLADLGGDVVALFDALGIERAHYCGLSIGGLVAQWLALHASHRIERVAVCATAAKIGNAEGWHMRIADVKAKGLDWMTGATAERWFGASFRATHPDEVQRILDGFVATSVAGYAGCCAALAYADLRDDIASIGIPLLAISGDDDPVCPPSDLQAIADACGGNHVSLPGRHLVNVESPDVFNAKLRDFLS